MQKSSYLFIILFILTWLNPYYVYTNDIYKNPDIIIMEVFFSATIITFLVIRFRNLKKAYRDVIFGEKFYFRSYFYFILILIYIIIVRGLIIGITTIYSIVINNLILINLLNLINNLLFFATLISFLIIELFSLKEDFETYILPGVMSIFLVLDSISPLLHFQLLQLLIIYIITFGIPIIIFFIYLFVNSEVESREHVITHSPADTYFDPTWHSYSEKVYGPVHVFEGNGWILAYIVAYLITGIMIVKIGL